MSESPPREPDADTETDPTPVPVRERVDGYFRNGVWVPRGTEPDPKPASWRERLETRFGIRLEDRRLWIGAAAVLVVIIVVAVMANGGAPARKPREEREFLKAVQDGQTAVKEGNDITLVTAARDRARAVCALLPPGGAVKDWVGTISKVGTVTGGKKGQVAIKVADDVQLHTWSRASADTKTHTLVDPNSDVYQDLADLKSGDQVRFSGSFVPKGSTCLLETSIFARNGMLTPGFLFRFTAVDPR